MKKALATFLSYQVNLVVHAGDYVAPFTVALLTAQNTPWIGVLGNNDGEILGLFQKSGGRITSPYMEWREGPYSIWVSHDYPLAELAFASTRFDLCVYGHTHQPDIREEKRKFLINPGESSGIVNGKPTVAICDLKIRQTKLVEL